MVFFKFFKIFESNSKLVGKRLDIFKLRVLFWIYLVLFNNLRFESSVVYKRI